MTVVTPNYTDFSYKVLALFFCIVCTNLSMHVRNICICISASFYGEELLSPHPKPTLENTACRLTATAYSIYSLLPSVLKAVPPSENLKKRHAVVTGIEFSCVSYTYDVIPYNIIALIMQQLNCRCVHIPLHSDIKHVTCC